MPGRWSWLRLQHLLLSYQFICIHSPSFVLRCTHYRVRGIYEGIYYDDRNHKRVRSISIGDDLFRDVSRCRRDYHTLLLMCQVKNRFKKLIIFFCFLIRNYAREFVAIFWNYSWRIHPYYSVHRHRTYLLISTLGEAYNICFSMYCILGMLLYRNLLNPECELNFFWKPHDASLHMGSRYRPKIRVDRSKSMS